ncbi:hypothetical protein HY732_01005 [Candidatus Uhrbacteria bacterium]|nr:hypothetical protein [Candidatus Uhrbacteria bacterium]
MSSLACYNEGVAQEFFPLNKGGAQEHGYRWRDAEIKNVGVTKPASSLPANIQETDDSILKEIIGCAHEGTCTEQCTRGFKIKRKGLEFYRSMKLPLPRLCPNCRHYQRLAQRSSIFLHQRSCACAGAQSRNNVYKNTVQHAHGASPCPNKFKTIYNPAAPEIVYCEECYRNEVI